MGKDFTATKLATTRYQGVKSGSNFYNSYAIFLSRFFIFTSRFIVNIRSTLANLIGVVPRVFGPGIRFRKKFLILRIQKTTPHKQSSLKNYSLFFYLTCK